MSRSPNRLPRRSLALLGMLAACLWLLAACGRSGDAAASISSSELAERIEEGTAPLILDVRSETEYRSGHIPGAVNIPQDQLAERLSELDVPKSEEVVVHCEGGRRAALAEQVLVESGYTHVLDLEGHMKGWRASALPIE